MSETNAAAETTAGSRSAISVWMQAARMRSLIISSVSVLVGGALAYYAGHFDAVRLFLAWFSAVAVQTGTNLTNVHYNYKKRGRGAALDRVDPHGSTVVVEQGLLTTAQVWSGALVAFALGIASGITLSWMVGWQLLAVGIVGTIAGYSYAGPPLRVAYLGLGVPIVFIFMGPAMVVGTYYAMAGSAAWGAILVSISVGLLAAGILQINDIRDLETDIANRKHTLTTFLGRRGAAVLLAVVELIVYLAVIVGVALRLLPWPTLITLVTLSRAIPQVRIALREVRQDTLHLAWVRGVQLHLEFGVLLILALIVSRLAGI
jgi:1,4-dihydroxy-2-naphthoate octaprenyltransferase